MRIGIDAHAIGERRTGNERFVSNLIRALRPLRDHELYLYFTHREAAERWRGDGAAIRVVKPAHPLIRIPFSLPILARRDRLDALLVQYTGPLGATCPVITVVHDVAFALFPRYFSPVERLWMRRAIPHTMRHAAGIVTVSEFSKAEIMRVYGIPDKRIRVAYDGVDPVFLEPTPGPSPVEGPYFLAVGNLQPRKNLATVIRAYQRLATRRPDLQERLVIVGQEWFRAGSIYRESADLRRTGRIVLTGYVPDRDLVALLHGATALVYPSLYEGFGLPPVEAMAAGTPALVSDIPVMREVTAEAALRLPPTDEAAWEDAMLRVSSDAGLRQRMAGAGRARASQFTWERCARSVLAALESAARPGGC